MLVLSRRRQESIMVGDNIEITVVDITPGRVKLGINADRDVPVHRKELLPLVQPQPRRDT